MHLASRPPLARIMVIDQALRANLWPNAGTLGDQLEVTPRSIRRDNTYLTQTQQCQCWVRAGKYCRRKKWDGAMVRRVTRNPLLRSGTARWSAG